MAVFSNLRPIFLLLTRSLRQGELNVLISALIIAVATVSCINIFTDRIKGSIIEEASNLLAADAQIRGSMPIPSEWEAQARLYNLVIANSINYRAMAFSGDFTQLANVKAVSNRYPLKSHLIIAAQPYTEGEKVTAGPSAGKVWLSSRLFAALDIQVGDNIEIGDASFKVDAALIQEPDNAQSAFGFAPRAMINIDDAEKTGALQVGSRVNYTLMLKGEKKDISNFKQWITPKLGNHHRWRSVEEANRSVSSALGKAQNFFLLAGCLGVVLSGAAIALASKRYAKQQLKSIALLKTFGLRPKQVLTAFLVNLFIIGSCCILIGSITGWLLHQVLLMLLNQFLPVHLSSPSVSSFFIGGISGFIALFAFAAPPIFALRNVPPITILKQQNDYVISSQLKQVVLGVVATVILLYIYSQSIQLTGIIFLATCACIVGISLLSRGLILALKKSSERLSQNWRLGINSLHRHQAFNSIQSTVFAALLMLVFILVYSRSGLISQWQKQLPENAPNHFIFNIFPDDKTAVEKFFADKQIHIEDLYPMIPGRIITVNGVNTRTLARESESNINYRRELNLSWANQPGPDNKVVSGNWKGFDEEKLYVSAEQNYANGLGIVVGDQLRFSVAGYEFDAEVSSVRSVEWDSMNPNFYMLFNQPFLKDGGENWITSFYLPEQKKNTINLLIKQFPHISIIELDQTLEQVKTIIDNVSKAVEFILLLVSLSGILLLVTSVQATLDIRLQESAVIRVLGGQKKLIRSRLLIEFFVLGIIAGVIAAAGAQIALYFLAVEVFSLPNSFYISLWTAAPFIGAGLIGLVGWISVREVLTLSPLYVLKNH